MPAAYKPMLGFFELVNDVPGYEEMEFRRPGLNVDAGLAEAKVNGTNGVHDEGEEVDSHEQNSDRQTLRGNGDAGQQHGWVEDEKENESEGEMGKIDS